MGWPRLSLAMTLLLCFYRDALILTLCRFVLFSLFLFQILDELGPVERVEEWIVERVKFITHGVRILINVIFVIGVTIHRCSAHHQGSNSAFMFFDRCLYYQEERSTQATASLNNSSVGMVTTTSFKKVTSGLISKMTE